MKTAEELSKMIDDKLIYLSKHQKTSKEFKAGKREFDFYHACLLLVSNNLTQESIDRMINKLSAQYQKMKEAYYSEFWYGKPEAFRQENKRPTIGKFESSSGAGKIKQALKTYKFLQ